MQRALKDLGYYAGNLNGSLGVDTRQALSAYQQDYGLDTTGAVDEATGALGDSEAGVEVTRPSPRASARCCAIAA